MKKIFIIIAGLVAAGGLAYWQLAAKTGTKTADNGQSRPESAVAEFTGNLTAAMQRGVPMQCSWQSGTDTGESYVRGQNVYVATKVQGKSGYMIKKDDCLWTWGDAQPQGLKICNQEQDADTWTPDAGSYRAEGVDWNVEYHCRPAVFGAEKFTPPAEIEFTDMESMMRQMMPGIPAEE